MGRPYTLAISTVFALLLSGLCAWSAPVWITSDAYPQFHVIVADKAPDSEKLAAAEFQKYWKLATGFDATTSAKPGEGVNVWIGRTAMPEEFLVDVDLAGLGDDGMLIETFRRPMTGDAAAFTSERHLLFIGGKRGIVYAVYQFFEDHLGVRWLTPAVTYAPPHAPVALPYIQYRYVPPFSYRNTDYLEPGANTGAIGAFRLTHGPIHGLFGHTAYELLPPEKYFEPHPEFYSLIGGERRAPAAVDWRNPAELRDHPELMGQLCFSNPDVADAVAAELRERIQADPEPRIWSVAPMAWDGRCQCDGCRAVDEREGSSMGSLLTCVNRVAENIAEDFPHVLVETIAHDWSRKPPATLRPAGNVVIRLSTADCDFVRPISLPRTEQNRRFQDDLSGWAAIAPRLEVWDYAANQRNFQTPHPNLHTIQPNLRLFADKGVDGVYVQGCPSPAGEFGHLRAYLLAKCLWNPSTDVRAVQTEFLNLYYGAAAPFIQAYIELAAQKAQDADRPVGIHDTGSWMEHDVVIAAQELFRNAYDAVGESEELRARIDEAYLPVQYAAMLCPPQVRFSRYEVIAQRPPGPTLEEYVGLLESHGATLAGRGLTVAEFAERLGSAPSRRIQTQIGILENENYLVWIVPALEGAILRWRDKKLGVELLQGYTNYGKGPGIVSEWFSDTDGAEGPIASSYEVRDRTMYKLSVRAALDNGLVVQRDMELRPTAQTLEVMLTLTNEGEAPVVPHVKLRPEFYVQANDVPELFAHNGSQWESITVRKGNDPRTAREDIAPGGYRRWAVRMPARGFVLVNDFDAAQFDTLAYRHDLSPGAQMVSMGLVPRHEPIAPGRSVQIRLSYTTARRLP